MRGAPKYKKELFSYGYIRNMIKRVDKESIPFNKKRFNEAYKYLFLKHRFEYIYKNEFLISTLNNILQKNANLLYEVELTNDLNVLSILDLLYITEDSMHAIEIKSDQDSPLRLEKQIPNYSKLFEYVSVFVSDYKVPYYKDYLELEGHNNVGIIALTDNSIKTIKPPLKNNIDRDLLLINLEKTLTAQNVDLSEIETNELIKMWRNSFFIKKTHDEKFVNGLPRCLKFFGYSHSYLKGIKKRRLINMFP